MEDLDLFKRSIIVTALTEFIASRMGDAQTPEDAADRLVTDSPSESQANTRSTFLITLDQAVTALEIVADSIQEEIDHARHEEEMEDLHRRLLLKGESILAAEDERLHEVADQARQLIARIKARSGK